MRLGSLTMAQYQVLLRRGKGLTQRQTAKELGTSRGNVSMMELRAKRKVEIARETLRAYQSTLTDHDVRVPKGTRMYDIPPLVLGAGDRFGIHLQSNIVDIVRMVKDAKPPCLAGGRTTRSLSLSFNQAGKLRFVQWHSNG
jgi:Tfx family DNA-binding protein